MLCLTGYRLQLSWCEVVLLIASMTLVPDNRLVEGAPEADCSWFVMVRQNHITCPQCTCLTGCQLTSSLQAIMLWSHLNDHVSVEEGETQ